MSESESALLSGMFIYTYEELVNSVISRDRSTAGQQNDSDRTHTHERTCKQGITMIDNCVYRCITMDSFVCTGILCAIEV